MTRKLLQLDRIDSGATTGLRLESVWNKRTTVYLDTEEVRELTAGLPVLFPEHDEASRLRAQIATLFDAIAHGDDGHRAWLREAIDDHFAYGPVKGVAK